MLFQHVSFEEFRILLSINYANEDRSSRNDESDNNNVWKLRCRKLV